jgi:type IV pilus assembly protein PilB
VPPSLGGPPSSAASLPPWVTPFVQVTDYEPSPQIVALIPARMIQQYRLLPLGLRGNVLTVGMVNPRDGAAIAELKRVLASVEISVAAIGLDDFAQAVVRMRVTAALDASRKGGGHLAPDAIVYDAVEVDREAEKAGGRVIGDDVVQIVNRIVVHALEREASDIHMEPDVAGVKIRFRVHGMLVDWNEVVPPAWAKGLVARVKVLAGLDITERRAPQDGRIGLKIGRREVDLRVSTMPATRGEKVVLRVLEAATMARPLEHVFLEPTTLQMVRRALHRPFGAIVVAGPTGAGKTTTLYATLGERRRTRPDTNVVTIEDPVEYRLAGVTQVQVRHDAGLGFAQVLRSTLRQDPDVIMVGEVRDEETAHLALEASMTGHLLLTSIHANTAFSVMQRLENLRCDRTHIAQALAMVVVQRLARKLCSQCAKVEPPTPVLVETLAARGLIDPSAPTPLPRAVGCDACGNTGFSGRVAVIEALHMTDDVRSALMAGHSFPDIQRAAAQAQLLVPFSRYAAFLMAQRLLAPSDALLTLAE